MAAAVAAVLAGAIALPAGAAPAAGGRVGPETRVNTFTTGDQLTPAVGVDADGDYVIAWVDTAQDGGGYGIYAQRYNAAGERQGPEFQVNTTTAGYQNSPAVAMDADGDYVIVWDSQEVGQTAYFRDIHAQRYNAAGVPQGGEFRVNQSTAGSQAVPAVAMDSGGSFVVTWDGQSGQDNSGVLARIYNNAGVALTDEIQVNVTTFATQSQSAVGMNAAGNFVVAWRNQGNVAQGTSTALYGRIFAPTGAPQSGELLLRDVTGINAGSVPLVKMSADGSFVAAMVNSNDIVARRFDAAGVPQGTEFPVNTFTTGDQFRHRLAMDADGDFTVVWDSALQDGSAQGVYAQRYDAAGVPQGNEFLVNTFTAGAQRNPTIGMDADGDLVMAWHSAAQDGSGTGIYAQRFTGPEDVDLALAASASPDPVGPSSTLTYNFTVSNLHPAAAPTSIAVIDAAIGTATGVGFDTSLPAGFDYFGATGTDWTCADNSGALRCDYSGILAAAADTTVGVTAQASPTEGTYSLFAMAWGNQLDSNEETAGSNNEASADVEVTPVADTTPDGFSFVDQTNVTLSTVVSSSFITVSGINASTPISVLGGEYAVNGGSFTTSPGSVNNGDLVQVRHTSSATPGTVVSTTLTIGGVSDTFTSTTAAADTTPDVFTFVDQTDVPVSTVVVSNSIAVSGVNAATPVSVTGGEYSVNGGAFVSAAGTVGNGDTVRVRHTASASPATAVNTTLTIGGVSDTFTSTTAAGSGGDTTPFAFSFVSVEGVGLNKVVTSAVIKPLGYSSPAPISVSVGSEYNIANTGWTSVAGTINPNQNVKVRHTSAATGGTTVTTTLTIGGVAGTFSSTTVNDAIPDPFGFIAQDAVALNKVIVSAAVKPLGYSVPTSISVSMGSEYQIGSNGWTSAPGTINPNQNVKVRHTSASTGGTTVTTTLTIGGVAGTFSSTTVNDAIPDAFGFPSQTGVKRNKVIVSAAVKPLGYSVPASISVSVGSEYQIGSNGWTSVPGTINPNQNVKVRHTSALAPATSVTTTLTIGGIDGTFTSTTQ